MVVPARRHRTRRLGSALSLFGLIVAAACGGGNGDIDVDRVARMGEAYIAVLTSVLPATTTSADEPLPVVYVWEFTEAPMSLEDQVVVIDHFDDALDVRFVDHFDAAVDVDAPTEPPRDEALLIGLGPIPADAPHTVRVEFYEDADTISAVLVTLALEQDVWTVTDEEPVAAEAFDVVT